MGEEGSEISRLRGKGLKLVKDVSPPVEKKEQPENNGLAIAATLNTERDEDGLQ